MVRICSDFLRERNIKKLGDVPERFMLRIKKKEYEFQLKFYDERKRKCKVYVSRDMRVVVKFRDRKRCGLLPMKEIISSANEFEKFHLGVKGKSYGLGVSGDVTMVVTTHKGKDLGICVRECADMGKIERMVDLTKGMVCMLMSLMDMWMFVGDNEMRNFGVVKGASVVPLDEEIFHNAMEVGYKPKKYYSKIMETYAAYEKFVLETVDGIARKDFWKKANAALARGEYVLKSRMSGVERTFIMMERISKTEYQKRSRISTMHLNGIPKGYTAGRSGGWHKCKCCGGLVKGLALGQKRWIYGK